MITGNDGILNKTVEAKNKYLYSQDKELLELIVGDVRINNKGDAPTLDIYEEFIKEKNKNVIKKILYPETEITSENAEDYLFIVLETVKGNKFVYDTSSGKISEYENGKYYGTEKLIANVTYYVENENDNNFTKYGDTETMYFIPNTDYAMQEQFASKEIENAEYAYGKIENNIETEFNGDKNETININIYYLLKRYTIVYDANGGQNVPESQEKKYGSNNKIIISSTVPTKTGYTFNGWKDENQTTYTEGDEYSTNSDLILYAQWKGIDCSIVLNNNGATTNGSTSATVAYDSNSLSNITNPSKTDYKFAGWTKTQNGNDIVISASKSLKANTEYTTDNGMWNQMNQVTLYARWIKTTTEFSYNGKAQTYYVVANGNYTLKVYGAQGGAASTYSGGKGGYSTGKVNLTAGTTLYIYVGGQGSSSGTGEALGGYNGGGRGYGGLVGSDKTGENRYAAGGRRSNPYCNCFRFIKRFVIKKR